MQSTIAPVMEPDIDIEKDDSTDDIVTAPPVFGKCPICKKNLFPVNKKTGMLQAPPPGRGYDSRAKCGRCGAILYYIGNGEWGVLLNSDLTDDDRYADRLGME